MNKEIKRGERKHSERGGGGGGGHWTFQKSKDVRKEKQLKEKPDQEVKQEKRKSTKRAEHIFFNEFETSIFSHEIKDTKCSNCSL